MPSTTFWIGLFVLGGLTLIFDPLPTLHQLPGHQASGVIGALLVVACFAYALLALKRRGSLRLGPVKLALPQPAPVAGQFVLSLLDWMLAAAAAWVLLPAGRPSFPLFVGAFLAAQLFSMLSHVPGGVGVLETLLVLLLKPVLAPATLLPALLLYRVVYYLLPLALSLVLLVGDELVLRRDQARRVTAAFGSLTTELAPRMLAVFVFLAGAVLVLSGATPAEHTRLRWLQSFLPLGMLQASHFLASVVGVGLLLLSRGIARRLDASWYLAMAGPGLGVVASLLRGAAYEEATLLALLGLALLRARGAFDRKAAFFKLGEEARVPLERFSLEGGEAKPLRQSHRRLEREGCDFRVLEPPEVSARLAELREVSDDWLAQKGAAEKGFSLGFFREDYVRRLPAAVIERGPRIEAFATLWPAPSRVELTVDLMRYRQTAPKGVMEALFVHLLLWGQRQDYRWFGLGMAPLSGLEGSPLLPLWNRLANFLFEYGEAFYGFQGLRAYKEKFHPVWEARYLAYPGGLALPRILADVSALVAGLSEDLRQVRPAGCRRRTAQPAGSTPPACSTSRAAA